MLLERTKLIKTKIESDTQKPCRIWLVDSSSEDYYFDCDDIKISDDIPIGGNLLCLNGRILGLNT